jgi:hypothetical protein
MQGVLGDEVVGTELAQPALGSLTELRWLGHHDDPDTAPTQVGEAVGVDAGQALGEHRHLGLTCHRGGQQIRQVHAALEHDEAGA